MRVYIIRLIVVAIGFFLLLVVGACPEDRWENAGCLTDEECVEEHGLGFYCSDRYSPRECLCLDDRACGAGYFCNVAGICQPRVGCYTNTDCTEGSFCDLSRNRCTPEGRCISDIHCPIGQVCDDLTNQCRSGCRTSGDCLLGEACRCPDGDEDCRIGRCEYGVCDDSTFCPYGWICDFDSEEDDSVCRVDDRGPYCEHCEVGPGGQSPCGDWSNRCLVDTRAGGRANYCGVDCSHEQPCPSGFRCSYIVILTGALCRDEINHSDCPTSDVACEDDEDCPGGRCDSSGYCGGKCVIHEGDTVGWCTCIQDTDCPIDTCDTMNRRCSHTNDPCQLDGEENLCRGQLTCVNLYGRGGCVVGRNCAPQEGISCAEVRGNR